MSMGVPFKTKIKVTSFTNGSQKRWEEVDVLVDSGAAYTSLPRPMLERLGIPIKGKKTLRLADGTLIEREFGLCEVIIAENNVAGGTVVFANENDLPLLGMNMLDDASLAIDPVGKRLVPVQAIQA